MQIDTKRRPPTLNASLAVLFGVLSVLLLLLLSVFNHLFFRVRDSSDSWDMVLPYARTARPDENPEPERLTVRVQRDGTLIISGQPVTDEDIRAALRVEARLSRVADGSSDRTMLIAADERAPFKAIKRIVTLCNSPDIRIWRLAFATRPAPELGTAWELWWHGPR